MTKGQSAMTSASEMHLVAIQQDSELVYGVYMVIHCMHATLYDQVENTYVS